MTTAGIRLMATATQLITAEEYARMPDPLPGMKAWQKLHCRKRGHAAFSREAS